MVLESDIKGFESDYDDDLTHKCHLRSQIDLRNAIIEDEEAEDADNSDSETAGRPKDSSFDCFEWTKH